MRFRLRLTKSRLDPRTRDWLAELVSDLFASGSGSKLWPESRSVGNSIGP
jgi:hypothetical protein